MDQQDWPFHRFQMIQILRWVNSEPSIWAWVTAEQVSLLALSYPNHQGELSRTALGRPPNAAMIGRRQGQPSCSRYLALAYLHPLLRIKHHCGAQSRCWPHSTSAGACEGLGQLSRSHTLRAGLATPLLSGLAPFCCQGSLFRVLQPVRCKISSPVLMTPKASSPGYYCRW